MDFYKNLPIDFLPQTIKAKEQTKSYPNTRMKQDRIETSKSAMCTALSALRVLQSKDDPDKILDALLSDCEFEIAKAFYSEFGNHFKRERNSVFMWDFNDLLWYEEDKISFESWVRCWGCVTCSSKISELEGLKITPTRSHIQKLASLKEKFKTNRFTKDIARISLSFSTERHFSDTLNSNPDLLPTKGGQVVNLKTRESRDRLPLDRFSIECNARYREDVDLTLIDDFISSLVPGGETVMRFVQTLLGFCLTGHTPKEIFAFYGTGSRLIIKALSNILGEFFVFAGEQSLSDLRSHMGRARVICFLESPMLEQRVRELLYSKHSSKFILITDDASSCAGRYAEKRVILAPFQINELGDSEMFMEKENFLDSFFLWCLEGARRWYEKGIDLASAPRESLYRIGSSDKGADLFDEFLDQRCAFVSGHIETLKDITKAYNRYTKGNVTERDLSVMISSNDHCARLMKEKLLTKKRHSKGQRFIGIKILSSVN